MKRRSILGSILMTLFSAFTTPALFFLAGWSEDKLTATASIPYYGEISFNWVLSGFILLIALVVEAFEVSSYESLGKPKNVGFALGVNAASIIAGVALLVSYKGVLTPTVWMLIIWAFLLFAYVGQFLAKTNWERTSVNVDHN